MAFTNDQDSNVNQLVAAVQQIEQELGPDPNGVYASVRTRLDILEARINNPFAPGPNVINPFYIGNTGVSIQVGYFNPNIAQVPAITGSLFLDGYSQGLFIYGTDGLWHQVPTAIWTAGCDLSGTDTCQTVIGIQGRPINPIAPQTDSEGDGYTLTWNSSPSPNPPSTAFAILAGSGITNTGNTTITGNVGSYPTATETGFGTVTLIGTNHGGDSTTQAAKTALTAQYNAASTLPVTATIPTQLGGLTYNPGIYNSASGTFNITGTLILDAGGNSEATWVFQAASTLITAASSNVILLNGALASNVTWTVGSSATLGTSSNIVGSILAVTSITLTTGATVIGQILAQNGAVTLGANTITAPGGAIGVGWWEPQIGFFAAGDLSGNKLSQKVIGIQGRSVSSSAPALGNTLEWNGSQWLPGPINLVGGAASVTGQLPPSNLGSITITGDVTGSGSGGTITTTTLAIHGTTVPAGPSTNQVLVATSGTTSIWQFLIDSQISASAGILGTKIVPSFGSQNIITTGNLNTQNVTGTGALSITGAAVIGGSATIDGYLTILGNTTVGGNLLLNGYLNWATTPRVQNQTLTMTDTTFTVSSLQYNAPILRVISSVSLTATRNFILPLFADSAWHVYNNTAGSQSIQIIGTTGTGYTLANGASTLIWTDGVNFYKG